MASSFLTRLLFLVAVYIAVTADGFVLSVGKNSHRQQQTTLSAVQVDDHKTRRCMLDDEGNIAASRLEELIQRTPLQTQIIVREGEENGQDPSDQIAVGQSRCGSSTKEGETFHQTEDCDYAHLRWKFVARASLLKSRSGAGRKQPPTRASSYRSSTSVGSRRIGSATKARQSPGMTKRIMDAVRKSATSKKPSGNGKRDKDSSNTPPSSTLGATSQCEGLKLTKEGIHAAVVDMMERRRNKHLVDGASSSSIWEQPAPMFIEPHPRLPTFCNSPAPGTILIPPATTFSGKREPKLQFPDCVTVRVAQGLQSQDTEVAHLRLSVFSDFSPDVRRQLVPRSVNAVVTRRRQGATCLVATIPPSIAARKRNRPPVILGSAECSFHEFEGTTLGQRRFPQSILYITEVAVSPNARRRGIGAKLLDSIDALAGMRKIETLYLHVDVQNKGAVGLYERAGYMMADSSDPMFLQFTTKLNLHDGATKGRNHFLLYKDLVKCPTWLQVPVLPENKIGSHLGAREYQRAVTGILGFEFPC